jgi:hypothetical protein
MNNKDCETIAILLYQDCPNNISSYFSLDKRIKEHYDTLKEIEEENSSILDMFNTLMLDEYGYDYTHYSLRRIRPVFPKANDFLRQSIESVVSVEDIDYKFNELKGSYDYILFLTKE